MCGKAQFYFMMFTLPLHVRHKLWRLSLKMRKEELHEELVIRQTQRRHICDMLSNHHKINYEYVLANASHLSAIFHNISRGFLRPPITDLSDWLQVCKQRVMEFTDEECVGICELIAAIVVEYVYRCKPVHLSHEQISQLLSLHELIKSGF